MDEQGSPDKSQTEKRAYKRSKQGEVTRQEQRDIAQLCRHGAEKAKAHLELNLVGCSEKRLGKTEACCGIGQVP